MTFSRWIIKNFVEPIKWTELKFKLTGRRYDLTDEDLEEIWSYLAKENYIIGTWRSTHATSYAVATSHFLLSVVGFIKTLGKIKVKFGKWSHILMNIEENENPQRSKDFILVEAIGVGSTRSEFKDVFNCDRVILLKPKAQIEWEKVNKTMLDMLNRPYDYEFKLDDNSKVSCVEYTLDGLKSDSTFADDFSDLIEKMSLYGNLEPSMFADSSSFEVVLMIDRTKKRGVKYVGKN